MPRIADLDPTVRREVAKTLSRIYER